MLNGRLQRNNENIFEKIHYFFCSGMNEHPIARRNTILRQGEFPAHFLQSGMDFSIDLEWSIMAGQWKKKSPTQKKVFFSFYIDWGGRNSHLERF